MFLQTVKGFRLDTVIQKETALSIGILPVQIAGKQDILNQCAKGANGHAFCPEGIRQRLCDTAKQGDRFRQADRPDHKEAFLAWRKSIDQYSVDGKEGRGFRKSIRRREKG